MSFEPQASVARVARPPIARAYHDDLHGTPWRRLLLHAARDIWCLVDADDYGWIVANSWNHGWHNKTPWKFYAKRNVGPARSTVYLHREILTRADPQPASLLAALHGHHRNGQSLDNRKANLTWTTVAVNTSTRVKRVYVPSLDAIVAQLLAELPRDDQDLPF